jgi:hypothetical protein
MKEFLEAYSNTAKEQWPNHLAKRFHTLALHFDRTVRQFPKWREFVRNAQQDRLTAEQAAAVPALTEAMVQALRDKDAEEFIDPAIPQALENLQASDAGSAIGGGEIRSGQPLLAEDIVESISNIAKEAFAAALADVVPLTFTTISTIEDRTPSTTKAVRKKVARGTGATAKAAASGYADEAQKSIVKEAKRLGKETGPAITRWVKRFVFGSGFTAGGSGLAYLLIHAFPDKFGWLQALMGLFS